MQQRLIVKQFTPEFRNLHLQQRSRLIAVSHVRLPMVRYFRFTNGALTM